MNIRQIIKEEIDNSIAQTIIPDLFSAVESSKEISRLYKLEDYVYFEGKLYNYYISYEVTERPHIISDSGDYWTPPSSEVYGDFDFDITEISVYTKDGEEVCEDFLNFLSKEEYSKLKDMFDFDLYEVAYSNEEWDEMNEPDWDALRKDNMLENKTQITEHDILYMVKRAINEVASKRTAINRIYKVTNELTSKIYRNDDYWNGPRKIVKAIKSLGYEVGLGAKDGGYRKSSDGMSQWKEYQIDIDTPEGFNIQGTLNCHAAGSIEDPFDRYDMSLVMW